MKIFDKINNVKWLNKRNLSYISLLLVTICVLSMLAISFYTTPFADDYSYSTATKHALENSGII